MQFLKKNPLKRLGAGEKDANEVKGEKFFEVKRLSGHFHNMNETLFSVALRAEGWSGAADGFPPLADLSDHRLGSAARQDGHAALPAVHQGVLGRQQLRQRVHAAAAGPDASAQVLQPLGRAAGRLRRLRLLRLARMTADLT